MTIVHVDISEPKIRSLIANSTSMDKIIFVLCLEYLFPELS